MLKSLRGWAHVWVGVSVLLMTALAYGGVIGEPARPEKIEQLQVVLSGDGEAGVRVSETIDHDFGTNERRGVQLIVPNDFGAATNVTASSETAPDDVSVEPAPYQSLVDQNGMDIPATRIRVGDPDITISGQHRYEVAYTLPSARFAAPTYSHDVVGAFSEFPIEDVTVVFDGIELADPTCSAGEGGTTGGCDFSETDPLTVEVDRLDAKEGITVRGEVTQWDAGGDAPDPGPLPAEATTNRPLMAGVVFVLGTLAAALVYLWARRSGANEVVGMAAAEAAHGVSGGAAPVRKVSDAELEEMVTVEFAPPKGIEPWQGQVALTEVLDDDTVTAWFSGAIAADVLDIEDHRGKPRLSRGSKADEADAVTQKVLRLLMANREVVDLDSYDANFAAAWTEVSKQQADWVRNSGWWWSRPPTPGRGKPGGCLTALTLILLTIVVFVGGAFLLGLFGAWGGWVTALLFGIGVPFLVARVAYAPLRPGRTANGSAYALQTASFRRFLVESEGQYVEWAWKHGLLRQYSAWAVALDAADAWREAMERAGVPQPEIEATSTPLLVHSMHNSFASSRIAPSTSSSSGGSSSSFSSSSFGGSTGGGGGGGSHGSW